LIVPHAGYMWSGPTAAYSYKLLEKHIKKYKTIFVLGNSHSGHFFGCGISNVSSIQTPFGFLKVN